MSEKSAQQVHANELFTKVFEACSKVVVGKRPAIELLLTTLLADGHALLEGPPGVAKTHIAHTFANLGLRFQKDPVHP